ncbi:MAG TPA: hypothetical protein VHE54_09705 [Puia sp.]|nr:hypothetical protein [Puia sp.]
MSTRATVTLLISTLSVLGVAVGCAKTTTVVVNPGASITGEVHYSKDIGPLLNTNCALSGCHVPGGHAPDLTAANAYQSLTTGGYVSPGDPGNSVIMLWLTGKKSPAMPLGRGPQQDIIAEIYAWIAQGAKNN